ncbi:ABC transporter substrate-binding protein [Ruania alba]|uniref:Carbohydrate ABC transporter substrate-binding protein, CUT1 family n=1 Tax=Ruania alba TaxID=648782 RepID=A0A1H5N0M6_9MICO|nr:extracellular solute-binding protein [Ruania alba]SEE95152.1 carbohydrate ABC transporter substrate-binding protein, CUT1 family [Ruania alba]
MTMTSRRGKAAAGGLVFALGLSLGACGSDSSGSDGDVTLRVAWWGSQERHENFLSLIETYESENPGVTIEAEYSDSGGHWDRLATTTAGQDAPDVISFDKEHLFEYGGRGALLDLNTLDSMDTSDFPEASMGQGSLDGELYGLPFSQNAYTVIANEDLFADAGVELPDDAAWTWDDYYRITDEVATALGGEVRGSDYGEAGNATLEMWLGQNGESLYADDGSGIGYEPATASAWFAHLEHIRDSASGPSPDEFIEEMSGVFEEGRFLTNRTAMAFYYASQLPALEAAADSSMELLRPPSPTGDVAENGLAHIPSWFWGISSQSENTEAAGELLNFLSNDERVAETMLVSLGVPASGAAQETILPELDATGQEVVSFIGETSEESTFAPAPAPPGAGAVGGIVNRYMEEVLFSRLTPDEAAEQMTAEIEAELDRA